MNQLRVLVFCLFIAGNLSAQTAAADQQQLIPSRSDSIGAPVVLSLDTLFYLYGQIGPFTAQSRSEAVGERLGLIATSKSFDSTRVGTQRTGANVNIIYGDTVLLTLTPVDAAMNGQNLDQLAGRYAEICRDHMTRRASFTDPMYILKIAGSLLLFLVILGVLIWLLNRAFRNITHKLVNNKALYQDKLNLHKYKLITVKRQQDIVRGVVNAAKWLVILIVMYLGLPILFTIAPLAEGVATKLIGYVTYPLKTGFWAVVGYIPSLIAIILIIVVVRVVVRVLRSLSMEVAAGKVELKGFYPDWAMPTFKMLKFVIYIFTFVLIFPLLPGSGSAVFQGVSVFLGLLISLGSQSAISNIISGLVITYMRAFNIGDRVRIGETTGDVIERSLLVTKVRTIKNEDVTIPNSNILTSHTTNFTTAQHDQGLIIHTTVTIGYDVPWRKVKDLLINSALKTDKIEQEPEPFVLQTSLDDFYVSYQLNAYTKRPAQAAKIYSELHGVIQDEFAKADVEIMSPHYRVNRQTMETTIPTEFGEPGQAVEHQKPPSDAVEEDE